MLTTYLPCLKNKGIPGLVEPVKDVDLVDHHARRQKGPERSSVLFTLRKRSQKLA